MKLGFRSIRASAVALVLFALAAAPVEAKKPLRLTSTPTPTATPRPTATPIPQPTATPRPTATPTPQPAPAPAAELPVASVSASDDDGNVPANVLDGNLATRWSSLGVGQYITLDLGDNKYVSSVAVAWYLGNQRQNTFVISVAKLGEPYVEVYSGVSALGVDLESYSFPEEVARFVRVTVYGNTSNDWASIAESRAFGSDAPDEPAANPTPTPSGDSLDVFGIRQIYPSAVGGPAWNSAHWSNGKPRSIAVGSRDPYDPTGVSQVRGSNPVTIDGNGVLTFSGSEPRFYLNSPSTHFFGNVEMTIYYKRVSDDGTAWGGIVLGARSGPNGHTTSDSCDAHTYYTRLRHDGRKDFEKELQHPTSTVRNQVSIWTTLPYNTWIGMKFVVRNVDSGQHIKLEQYRDLSGGVNGGTWEKMNETIDTGGWNPQSSCGFTSDFIPVMGGGVSFFRDTGSSDARYKWFTVREIDPAN